MGDFNLWSAFFSAISLYMSIFFAYIAYRENNLFLASEKHYPYGD